MVLRAGEVNIVYRLGKENISADTLSRQPYLPAPDAWDCLQVAPVRSANTSDPEETSIQNLFFTLIRRNVFLTVDFSTERRKHSVLARMIEFLESGELPEDEKDACKIASQASLFILIDDILYFLDLKHGAYKRIPVPQHL